MPTGIQTSCKEVRHARVREVMEREGFDPVLALSNAKLRINVESLHRWDSTDSSGPSRRWRGRRDNGGKPPEGTNEAFVAPQAGDVGGVP